jgi:hypothetical protein
MDLRSYYATPAYQVTKPEPLVYWVQDKQATWNEYVVSIALEKYRISYIFQASYWGGRQMRGGVILDFLVYAPFEMPVEVYGDYWHRGQLGANDRYRLSIIEEFFGKRVALVWGNESTTVPDAIRALRRERVIL